MTIRKGSYKEACASPDFDSHVERERVAYTGSHVEENVMRMRIRAYEDQVPALEADIARKDALLREASGMILRYHPAGRCHIIDCEVCRWAARIEAELKAGEP